MNSIIQVLNSASCYLSEALFQCHDEKHEKEACDLSYGVVAVSIIVAITGAYAIKRLVFSTQKIPPHENFLVRFDDKRGWLSRIKDLSFATAKEFNSRWQRQFNPLKGNARDLFPALQLNSNTYDIDEQQWRNSSKLIVLIHGLNSSPLAWTNYLEEISKSEKNVSCFAPFVFKKGYCKCKEAARPILGVVQKYANQYSGNHIFLVGHSYGATIAAYVEQKLNAENIHLISIAGPHCGSKLVNRINTLHLTRCFGISVNMVKELTYQGSWATKKLIKWHKQQGEDSTRKNIERVFFASSDDWRVFPPETSFPNLPNSSHFLLSGESHVTIIDAVLPEVISYIGSSK